MISFDGKVLNIGDRVVFIAPRYRSLAIGEVISFTPKFVRVAYMNTWNYGTPGLYCELLQDSKQLVRYDNGEMAGLIHIVSPEDK